MRLLILLFILNFGCKPKSNQVQNVTIEPTIASVANDTILLKPHLYLINGTLAFNLDRRIQFKFDLMLIKPNGEVIKKDSLGKIIDTATFRIIGYDYKEEYALGNCYFADKNFVYTFTKNQFPSGGWFLLNKLMDPETLQPLKGTCYAKDAKHVYYNGKVLEDVDFQSFKTIKDEPMNAKDKNGFFFGKDRMTPEDAKRYLLY